MAEDTSVSALLSSTDAAETGTADVFLSLPAGVSPCSLSSVSSYEAVNFLGVIHSKI